MDPEVKAAVDSAEDRYKKMVKSLNKEVAVLRRKMKKHLEHGEQHGQGLLSPTEEIKMCNDLSSCLGALQYLITGKYS